MRTLTIKETELLTNILFNDCSYLETCTEDEYRTYREVRSMLDETLFKHRCKVADAQAKQPKAEW